MKRDIPILKVEDIAIFISPENDDPAAETWDVFLINFKEKAVQNVLVNSKGYGLREGEKVETSVLRYFYDEVPSKSYVKIEVLVKDLLGLANEFWLSFNLDNHMYDKKYIFVSGSLNESNFTTVQILNRKGVMIR